jgi:hypothetical protein
MAEVAEFEDDMDEVQDLEDIDDEVDGEDLFGDGMMRYIRSEQLLTPGITANAPKRISMILPIWTTIRRTMTSILRLVDKSRRSLIDETENLLVAAVFNDLLRFSIPVGPTWTN